MSAPAPAPSFVPEDVLSIDVVIRCGLSMVLHRQAPARKAIRACPDIPSWLDTGPFLEPLGAPGGISRSEYPSTKFGSVERYNRRRARGS